MLSVRNINLLIKKALLFSVLTLLATMLLSVVVPRATYAAPTTPLDCESDQNARLLGIIPKWYKYLPYEADSTGNDCSINLGEDGLKGDGLAKLLPVGLAVIEMLLAVAGIVAVAFVIVGGFNYILSQGEPDHTKAALSTIINALIGGAIAIVATAVVAFIGGRFG